jgi:CBS domain containing-hemolysin-like protein
LAFALAFTLVTTLHIVVGEQAPKIMALQHPERTSLWSAAPTELFLIFFKPFIRLLSQASSGLVRLLRVAPRDNISTVHSEEEIKMLLAAREEAGLLDPIEKEMIGRIFSCCDLVAGQVMVPRTEAVCIPHDYRLKDLLAVAAQESFDRFPVFRENLDDIVGVVHVRELLAAIQDLKPKAGLERPISSLIRPITSVPHSLPVPQLLARMRQEGARMVLILDEYGGTDGIATWGSILERIVGEMHDMVETQEPPDIEGLPDGSYRLSGLLLTEEVGEHLGVSIEDPHNDTIGGVVFSRLGRKPEVGDTVEVEGFHFRVEALDGLRIDRLVVLPPSGSGPTSIAVAG